MLDAVEGEIGVDQALVRLNGRKRSESLSSAVVYPAGFTQSTSFPRYSRNAACSVSPCNVTPSLKRPLLTKMKRSQIVARIPLGRVAEPKDVVGATLFFASPASDFVTGQILYLDGGITASQ